MSPWRWIFAAVLACSETVGPKEPHDRQFEHLAIHGAQRLAALAKVGALTHTTMLVEVGDMHFMQLPVEVTMEHGTVREAGQQIMGSAARYTLRDRQGLLILSTARVRDRLLTLRLGHYSNQSGGISGFDPLLAETLREASGCKAMGTAWAGPDLPVSVPKMDLAHSNFEDIVAEMSKAPQPTMWIFQTHRRPAGCIDDPNASWEIGAYGFGNGFSSCQDPFEGAYGPQFVDFSPRTHAFPEHCPGVELQGKSWPPF